MIPQLIIMILGVISFTKAALLHGENKKASSHNGWVTLIALIISWTILYYGGFWDVMLNVL